MKSCLRILKQDSLRYSNGEYPSADWIIHFIENKNNNCFAYGYFLGNKLIGVIIAEKITAGGCLLWYVAIDKKHQSKGYGGEFLKEFESEVKNEGVEWVFLNSGEKSLSFYKKHNYLTSSSSKVFEHVKEI